MSLMLTPVYHMWALGLGGRPMGLADSEPKFQMRSFLACPFSL